MQKEALRVIDANINRAKEGLRICEDICRFVLDNRGLAADLKRIRHGISVSAAELALFRQRVAERNGGADAGRHIIGRELKRDGVAGIFFANIQRAKESCRVLEEFSKLSRKKASLKFKELRYELYAIEKKALKLIPYPESRNP